MAGMAVNPNNFVIIGQDPASQKFFIHERKNENGKPGKIELMGDGKGDVKKTAESYVTKGYDPSHIIINGAPATDMFEKKDTKNVAFKAGEETKKTGGWGKAIASAFIPGLGQFLDGRNKEGARSLGTAVGLGVVSTGAAFASVVKLAKAADMAEKTGVMKTPVGAIVAGCVAGLAGLGYFANDIFNIVDAYKGGKK